MRFPSLELAVLGLTCAAAAQMPLPAAGTFFSAGLTRGFYFQAPVNCMITGLAVPDVTDPFQVIEVTDLGLAAPPAFPATVTGTQLFYDNSTPGQSIVPVAIPLVAGNYYGVLGAGTATIGGATSQNPYSTATGTFTSDILGIPVDIARWLTQSGIGATGGNQPGSAEPGGTISRVEVYVAGTGGGTIATNTILGEGCVREFASFYETLSAANMDLSGVRIDAIDTGSGYIVQTSAGAGITVPAGAVQVPLGDDDQLAVGTLGLVAGSNCWLALGAGNSNAFAPTPATMLSNPSAGVYAWTDFEPNAAGSGLVYYDEPNATTGRLTYDAVWGWGTMDPNTVQLTYDTASGDFSIEFGTTATTNPEQWLVGYSPAGSNLDPGSVDISATPLIQTFAGDLLPLSVAPVAGSRAILGSTWDLSVDDIPANTVFGVTIFGTGDPAILDLGFLGLPGCQLRASLDYVGGPWTPGGTSYAYGFPVPATPTSLIGFELFTQAATFGAPPVNGFGAITSNGVKATIGDI